MPETDVGRIRKNKTKQARTVESIAPGHTKEYKDDKAIKMMGDASGYPELPLPEEQATPTGDLDARANTNRKINLFRKIKFRNDDRVWVGLSRWDDRWASEIEKFQLPEPIVDINNSSAGAFKRKSSIKPWAVEGQEETSTYGWGWGGEGRLGHGTGRDDKTVPTLVNRALEKHTRCTARFVDIACGRQHNLAVTEDGVLYAWGGGQSGQLGSRKIEKFRASESEDEFPNAESEDESDQKQKADFICAPVNYEEERNGVLVSGAQIEHQTVKQYQHQLSSRRKRRSRKREQKTNLGSAFIERDIGSDIGENRKPHTPVAQSLIEIMDSTKRNMLRRPVAVMPSGFLKRGTDLVAQEVAAGSTTSFAREATVDEGKAAVAGMQDMTEAVNRMIQQYPESAGLIQLRTCKLLAER